MRLGGSTPVVPIRGGADSRGGFLNRRPQVQILPDRPYRELVAQLAARRTLTPQVEGSWPSEFSKCVDSGRLVRANHPWGRPQSVRSAGREDGFEHSPVTGADELQPNTTRLWRTGYLVCLISRRQRVQFSPPPPKRSDVGNAAGGGDSAPNWDSRVDQPGPERRRLRVPTPRPRRSLGAPLRADHR